MKCKNKYCNHSKPQRSKYCSITCWRLDNNPNVDNSLKRTTGLKVVKNKAVRGGKGKALYFHEDLPEILTTVYPHQ